MKRVPTIAAGVILILLVGAATLPAKAQDAGGAAQAATAPLPVRPEPVAKPAAFAAPNLYEYPKPKPRPFVPAKTDFETVSPPIATRLEPYRESRGGFAAQDRSPQAQNEIRVYTNEVIAPVTVLDKRGQLVLDLEQRDFHIFDNGTEQKIVHWDLGGDPLAVALVIETSTHLLPMAPVIRGMGSIFTETVMALNGEAAVITFDSTVDLRQAFTTDHDEVQRAIAAVQFETPEMRLYDAMNSAVGLLSMQPGKFRRVMLVVGESHDLRSDAKLGLILRAAQLANISIYAVGPSSSAMDLGFADAEPLMLPGGVAATSVAPGKNRIGRPYWNWMTAALWIVSRGTNEIKNHQLEVAVAATGGVHYRAFREGTMRTALDQIGSELHAQYIVGYVPSANPVDGFHAISVTVARPETTVRTRPGYFLAPPADLTAPAAGEATSHAAEPSRSPSSTPE
jgi:VWFA-related protein